MLVGLDLNADRLLAIQGTAQDAGQALAWVGGRQELPLALSFENRKVAVGQAGLATCRKAPHQACVGFLPSLGDTSTWRHGRTRLDAAQALALVLADVKAKLGKTKGVALALPGYLSRHQVNTVMSLAKKTGLPITGAVTRALACSLSSYADHPWHNVAVVVDVDDHALTIAILRAGDLELNALGQKVFPALGLKAWRDRLVACVADTCVRTSRRDPRACPEADQMVFDQLDDLFEACSQGRPITLRVNGVQWFQTLNIQANVASQACEPLARQTAAAIQSALRWAEQQLTTASIYFTAQAARLPGLAGAVYAQCENKVSVAILPDEAAARAAFELAQRIERRELPQGLFEPAAPLPLLDTGVAPDMIPFPAHLRKTAQDRS